MKSGDGEYVLSGSDIVPCANTLIARGIPPVDLRVSGKVQASTDGSCQLPNGRPAGGLCLVAAGLALVWARRLRRVRR